VRAEFFNLQIMLAWPEVLFERLLGTVAQKEEPKLSKEVLIFG
jgi:hypothetical protein